MNKTRNYKLDSRGIVAFVVCILIMTVSNAIFSNVWTDMGRYIFYDVIICICATLYGPIIGALTGFLGVVCECVLYSNAVVHCNAISFGILGLFVGGFAIKYGIMDGEFKGKNLIIWNIVHAMGVIITLYFLRPYLDFIIYNKDIFTSLKEGQFVVLICTIPEGIVITTILYLISKFLVQRRIKKSIRVG